MVEVTSQNFEEKLTELDLDLQEASFTCLDFEFSGLHTNRCPNISLFDSPQERYSTLRESVKDFTVLQCGLSVFRYDRISRIYHCKTYNFWIFPRANEWFSRQTQFESSACEFLMKFDFDFNKCFYGGIPYLNEEEIRTAQRQLTKSHEYVKDIVLNDVKLGFRKRKLDMLAKWAIDSRPGEVIEIDCMSGGMCSVLLADVNQEYDDLIASKPKGESCLLVIKKATTEELAARSNSNKEVLEQKFEKAIGFTHVVRLIKKHRKPIVGHNLLMDLLFIYEKFHEPLPESFLQFKQKMHNAFPTIFDTRHIISNMKVELRKDEKYKELFRGTSLLSLYEECTSENVKGLMYQPLILDNLGEECGMREHDAGYDSCLVGHVFLRLAHFYALWKYNSPSVKPFHFQDYLREFSKFENSLNLIRSALSHISLSRDDPETKRPQWLLVSDRNKSNIDKEHVRCVLSAFGDVSVKTVSPHSCLVAMPSIGMAAGLLVEMKNHNKYKVVRYEQSKSWVNEFLGLAVIGSFGLIAGCLYFKYRS